MHVKMTYAEPMIKGWHRYELKVDDHVIAVTEYHDKILARRFMSGLRNKYTRRKIKNPSCKVYNVAQNICFRNR